MKVQTKEKKIAVQILKEVVNNIETVVTLREDLFEKRYQDLTDQVKKRKTRIGVLQATLIGMNQFIVFLYFASIFYIGAVLTSATDGNIYRMLSALFAVLFAVFHVFAALQLSADFKSGMTSIRKLYQYLDMKSEIDIDNPLQDYKKPIKGQIEFKNVNFAYPGTKYMKRALKEVSFKINIGEKVVLIGSNGSGKSTIFKLLMRYYDINEGEILIDGVNIKTFDLRHLRRRLRLIEQHPKLFYGSIENNIK